MTVLKNAGFLEYGFLFVGLVIGFLAGWVYGTKIRPWMTKHKI